MLRREGKMWNDQGGKTKETISRRELLKIRRELHRREYLFLKERNGSCNSHSKKGNYEKTEKKSDSRENSQMSESESKNNVKPVHQIFSYLGELS
jgi:predicted ATPase